MKETNARNSPAVAAAAAEEENNARSVEGERRRGEQRGRGERKMIGEVAGGTAAECAAICCCCPCGTINLLVLALYKLPAGLCRKMWRNRKLRQKKKNSLLQQRSIAGPPSSTYDDSDVKMTEASSINAVDLDNEMWTRFYGTGFWRSSSQRDV